MLPKSFVIEPEFNDLPSDTSDDGPNEGAIASACTIKQVSYRLYPTYRISVRDNNLCGVTSSSSSIAVNDNVVRSNLVLPSSRGEHAMRIQRSELDELDKLDDTIYASKASLLVVHIRFPVVKSLRTKEDSYASLVCAPEYDTGSHWQVAAGLPPTRLKLNEFDHRRYQANQAHASRDDSPHLVGDATEPNMEESQVVTSARAESTTAKSADVVVWPSDVFANSIRRIGELAVGASLTVTNPTSPAPSHANVTTTKLRGLSSAPIGANASLPVQRTKTARLDMLPRPLGSTSSMAVILAELANATSSITTAATTITTPTTTTADPASVSDLNLSPLRANKLEGRGGDHNVGGTMGGTHNFSNLSKVSKPGVYSEVRISQRPHVTNCTLGKYENSKWISSSDSELNMFLLVLFLAFLMIIFIFAIILDNMSTR